MHKAAHFYRSDTEDPQFHTTADYTRRGMEWIRLGVIC